MGCHFCVLKKKGETSFFLFWFPRRSFLRWFIFSFLAFAAPVDILVYLGHFDGVPLLTCSLEFKMFSIYKFTTISLSITVLNSYIQFSFHQYLLKVVFYACFMLKSFINFTYLGIMNKQLATVMGRDTIIRSRQCGNAWKYSQLQKVDRLIGFCKF